MSLIDFLHQEKWTTELIEGFAKYGIGFGAYKSILELSFHEILRVVAVKNMDTKNIQLEGGNESLVNSFFFDDHIPLHSIIEYGYKVASFKTPKWTTEDVGYEIGNPQYPVHTSPTSLKDSLLLPGAARPSFRTLKIVEQSKLPFFAKRLDHYTLICSNAKKVAEFHVDHLQFELDSIKPVNSGTVSEGEHDMLNYILRPPGNKDMVMVVTEGLNDDTIFRKYMKAHGHGVHHFAFEVDNIDIVFAAIKERGIQTTSEKVTTDIISGLKKFFIAPSHAGFFIEMIERPSGVDWG